MKKLKVSIALGLSAVAALVLIYSNGKKELATVRAQESQSENETEEMADAAGWWNMLLSDPATGVIDLAQYKLASQQAMEMRKESSRSLSGLNWEEMGPDNIGGRTRAILFDKNNPNRVYAGGVSGGLFISDNKGASWYRWSGSDQLPNLCISCMAQGADGAIYFGTGEYFPGIFVTNVNGAGGFPGNGIYKSTDNGVTFTRMIGPSTQNTTADAYSFINGMAADPNNPQTVYAATNGGLKISINGGTTWSNVSGAPTGVSADVEVASNSTVHAIISNHYYRKRTTDATFISSATLSSTGVSRFNLAVSPSNPNYVYALESANPLIHAVMKSTDEGSTWTQIAGASASASDSWCPVTQGTYALAIGVHPTNPDMVFIGGLDCYRYTTASSWEKISYWVYPIWYPKYVHADVHLFTFDPSNANRMYIGTDGGISSTENCTLSSPDFTTRNKNYNVTQFYSCAGIPNDGSVLAGAQDNGNLLRDNLLAGQANTPLQFNLVKGGDGGDVATSRLNPNVIFGEYVNGALQRSANRGLSFQDFYDTHVGSNGSPADGAEFIMPIQMWEKPNADTITNRTHKFFIGTYLGVWMTNNALLLSQNPQWFKLNKTNTASHVISLAVSKDGSTVYAGCVNGQLYRITGLDTTYHYTQINATTDHFYPDSVGIVTTLIHAFPSAVTGVATDDANPDHVVATMSGYTTGNHVSESMDATTGAATFTDITGNLPGMPVYSAAIGNDLQTGNATTVIVGTEHGVYARQGGTWSNVSNNEFPNVPVLKLRWVQSSPWSGSWLYASCYGRGVFRTSYFTQNLGTTQPDPSVNKLSIYPNPASGQATVTFETTKPETVVLSIFNLNGSLQMRRTQQAGSGVQSFPLDLSELAMGTYLVTVETSNGVQSSKLVVMK